MNDIEMTVLMLLLWAITCYVGAHIGSYFGRLHAEDYIRKYYKD